MRLPSGVVGAVETSFMLSSEATEEAEKMLARGGAIFIQESVSVCVCCPFNGGVVVLLLACL